MRHGERFLLLAGNLAYLDQKTAHNRSSCLVFFEIYFLALRSFAASMGLVAKSYELTSDLTIPRNPRFFIDVDWKAADGRMRHFRHTFTSLAEAQNWLKFC